MYSALVSFVLGACMLFVLPPNSLLTATANTQIDPCAPGGARFPCESSAGKAKKGKEGSWTGYITDSASAANEKVDKSRQSADRITGTVKEKGAKYVLYVPDAKKALTLEPQDKAVGHEGRHVKVTGTLDGDTIHVKSIAMVGEKKTKKD